MAMHLSLTDGTNKGNISALQDLLTKLELPFQRGSTVGIKLHWGEKGNCSFLEPVYAREIVHRLLSQGCKPFIFDTSVLYSGGRHNGKDALETAASHGFTEEYLGCPVVIADGLDGRDIIDIPAGFRHFKTVQVASLTDKTDGYVIFSHFKGHLAAGFGGAIKNISMGFASRAQKQRMHSDVKPILRQIKCTRCGVCVEVCPAGAAQIIQGEYPTYDLDLCIGCAQCIAQCPEMALRILWGSDNDTFQEKLVETAAAVWKIISSRTVLINAMIRISAECDCLPGKPDIIADDIGFVGGTDPVALDAESVSLVGADVITGAHPHLSWQTQFSHAEKIRFF
ncbi:MAG TPA: DUF362 domain-containing protein [Deltaproteobacteria bacterium]|nr:DUF362 domain-containing protein [Deltaproteobacteria bacterium]